MEERFCKESFFHFPCIKNSTNKTCKECRVTYKAEQPVDTVADKEMKKKAEDEIKRLHKETNINDVMTNAITSTYDEGTCITYLRSKKYKGK